MKLNEILEERKLALKVGAWFQDKAAEQIIKQLDAGTTAAEMAMHFNRMKDKQKENIRRAVKGYLERKDHKKLKTFYGMVGDE